MTILQVIQLADKNARARGLKWTVTTKETDSAGIAGRIRLPVIPGICECPLEVAACSGVLTNAINDLNLRDEPGVYQPIVRAADNTFHPQIVSAREHERDMTTRQLMLDTFEFEEPLYETK
jgi:hypothetical protein